MTIGEKLRAAREAKGLTQFQLAVKATVQPITVSSIEVGRNQPTVQTLCRLAKALGVEVQDLLETK
jgi:transcriptional regulator with XRE-family HTH domain